MREHKKIFIGSGHSLGKDYICAAISLWFLYSFSPSIVIQTAPTDRQVKHVMWGETMRHWNKRRYDLGGEAMADPLIKIRKEDWYLLGFTTKESGASREASGGKFSGFHSKYMCIIGSEAQAIENNIRDQIDGCAAGESPLVIFIGNPTRTTGFFAAGLKNTTENICFNFSCLENPNYIQRKEVIPGLASYEWVESRRREWGENDPRWYGRVLGQVPKTSVNTVIPEELYDRCIGKELLFESKKRGSIGVDPAMMGDDDMVISVFESGKLVEEMAIPKCSAPEGCSFVVQLQKKWFPEGQIAIVVDCDGLGAPFLDFIKKMMPDELNIVFVDFKGSCTDKEQVNEQYHNHRAELAFHVKQEMEKGNVSLDKHTGAKEEALADEYFVNHRGKIQIIDKQDIKDSIGRSPNRWDARKLAIWGFKYGPKSIKSKDAWARSTSLIGGGSHMSA